MRGFTAESLGLDIASIGKGLTEHWSFPVYAFYDPDIYAFELDAIFGHRWQYFAPLQKLAHTGDAVTGQVGDAPVVVTRAEDGELRGFLNICRHRGYRVAKGDMNCQRLVCGYHGWSYGLDGSLQRAPGSELEPSFCKEEFSLLPVAVAQWAQAVFVNPDVKAPDFHEVHPTLDRFAQIGGFHTEPTHYRLHREIVTEIGANWKLFQDNNVECYHCPVIHGEVFGQVFSVRDQDIRTEMTGNLMTRNFVPAVGSSSDASSDDELHGEWYCSFQLFPVSQMVQQNDMLLMARVEPTGPESCRFIGHYFAEQGVNTDKVDRWIDEVWNRTLDEDVEALVIQQENLRSGRMQRLRYIEDREKPALFFNGLVWDAYRQALRHA